MQGLRAGRAPLLEPGLDELLQAGLRAGRQRFAPVEQAAASLAEAELLWVAFDTPVDEQDRADVAFVRAELELLKDALRPGTLVLTSAQVPVGFTRARLERDWAGAWTCASRSRPRTCGWARRSRPSGAPSASWWALRDERDRETLAALFAPFAARVEWMSVESAEMSKHALNAFLATSVTFINELARLCERVGADAREVERGLKSEPRIGPQAYLSPGRRLRGRHAGARPALPRSPSGARGRWRRRWSTACAQSNATHAGWRRRACSELLGGLRGAGGDRAAGADLQARHRHAAPLGRGRAGAGAGGARRRGAGPRSGRARAAGRWPGGRALCASRAAEALAGADLAVVATEWPEFRQLSAADFTGAMRRARVVDSAGWFLAATLATRPGRGPEVLQGGQDRA